MKRTLIPENDCVTLQVQVDLDGDTNLIVRARSNGFAGSASGWLHINDVVSFGCTIRHAYPLLENERSHSMPVMEPPWISQHKLFSL